MARSAVALGAWGPNILQPLMMALNRSQKTDEEYEPPTVAARGSRVVLTSPNGSRYAVTVSNAGALVVSAL